MKKILLLIVSFLGSVPMARAYKLTVPFGQTTEATGPSEYITSLYTYALGLGTLLAMVMIVIGAVQYTLSEAITDKQDAKDRIWKAVWGLVLLLAATLILNILNPTLTTLEDPKGTFPDYVIPQAF